LKGSIQNEKKKKKRPCELGYSGFAAGEGKEKRTGAARHQPRLTCPCARGGRGGKGANQPGSTLITLMMKEEKERVDPISLNNKGRREGPLTSGN